MFFLLLATTTKDYYALIPSTKTAAALNDFISNQMPTSIPEAQLSRKANKLHLTLGKATQCPISNKLKVDYPYIDVFTTFKTSEDDPLKINFRPGRDNTYHYCFTHTERPCYDNLISNMANFFSQTTGRTLLSISVAARVSTYTNYYFSTEMKSYFGDTAPKPHVTLFKINFSTPPSGVFWGFFNPFIDKLCTEFTPFEGALDRLYKREDDNPKPLTDPVLDLTERACKAKEAEKQKTPPKSMIPQLEIPDKKQPQKSPKRETIQSSTTSETTSADEPSVEKNYAKKRIKETEKKREEAENQELNTAFIIAQLTEFKNLKLQTEVLISYTLLPENIEKASKLAIEKHTEILNTWDSHPSERYTKLNELHLLLDKWKSAILPFQHIKKKEPIACYSSKSIEAGAVLSFFEKKEKLDQEMINLKEKYTLLSELITLKNKKQEIEKIQDVQERCAAEHAILDKTIALLEIKKIIDENAYANAAKKREILQKVLEISGKQFDPENPDITIRIGSQDRDFNSKIPIDDTTIKITATLNFVLNVQSYGKMIEEKIKQIIQKNSEIEESVVADGNAENFRQHFDGLMNQRSIANHRRETIVLECNKILDEMKSINKFHNSFSQFSNKLTPQEKAIMKEKIFQKLINQSKEKINFANKLLASSKEELSLMTKTKAFNETYEGIVETNPEVYRKEKGEIESLLASAQSHLDPTNGFFLDILRCTISELKSQ